MKKDKSLKVIGYSILGIVFLLLAKALLFPTNYYGFGFTMNGNYGGEHMNMNGNYGLGFGAGTFSVLLVFIIKVLLVLFVAALLVGLVMAAKNYLFNSHDFAAFRNGFVPTDKPKRTCTACGKTLEDGWKVCPYCAAEVVEK